MFRLDEDTLKAYFRLDEYRRQRIWMQRIWHPELFDWDEGNPPPVTEATQIRRAVLDSMGFGESHYQKMLQGEEAALVSLTSFAELHSLWPHFDRIKGLGKYLCGAFIAAGGDISRPPTVSAFWKGMGLDVLPDGTVPRRIRGKKNAERRVPALPFVTKIGEQIRTQLMRSVVKGKELYHKHKELYKVKYPARPLMFAHLHGRRIAQKILYACLWEQWRIAYGLPAPWPYAFAILHHDSGGRFTIADFYDPPASSRGQQYRGASQLSWATD